MKKIFYSLFLLVCSGQVLANELQSWFVKEQTIHLSTTTGEVQLTALTDDAIEATYDADKKQLPSFSIAHESLPPNVFVTTIESERSLAFSTRNMQATIIKSPFSIRYEYKNRPLISEEKGFVSKQHGFEFRFSLQSQEKILGGGERVLGMDRRGNRLPLYNRAHYGYGTKSEQMNFSIPAIMSTQKYTLLFDNSAKGWMDIGKTQTDILTFEAMGGRKSYVIIGGDSYPNIIEHYVDVTGKQPLPPRWAFGNHASRFGYRSQKEVLDTIALYREKQVPVDSIILDLYWFGPDIQGHMGNLDWDRNTFPEPEEMVNTLKQQSVKTVLITEPFILTSSKSWATAIQQNAMALDLIGKRVKTFDFYFGNTGLVDVFSDSAKLWFGDVYKRLAKQGIEGVWGDLGEPEVHPADMSHLVSDVNLRVSADSVHNAYGHQWAKLVHTALNEWSPEKRQFIIMRSGFAGSQRYGMIPWTGDVSRSWDGLKPQVELSLQMGLHGMAYTHSDLGGFAGGESFDREMYLRWLQYGVFQPIYRPHAHDAIAPEPVFHDQETLDIARQAINLRYRLLPYNYTLAYENTTTGMPLMRPMFFQDEDDLSLIEIKDQYFWGPNFLVKPVTEKGADSLPVQLPEGIWFDYWRDTLYQGGQTIDFPVTLASIPVLVPAGAIIPSVDLVQSTQLYQPNSPLQLDYYFHSSLKTTSANVYDDDGVSADAIANGEFDLLQFVAQVSDETPNDGNLPIDVLEFGVNHLSKSSKANEKDLKRDINLVIHNWRVPPSELLIDGVVDKGTRYQWHKNKAKLTITIKNDERTIIIKG